MSLCCQQTALEGKLKDVLWASGKSLQINTRIHRKKWRAGKLTHAFKTEAIAFFNPFSEQTDDLLKVVTVTGGLKLGRKRRKDNSTKDGARK